MQAAKVMAQLAPMVGGFWLILSNASVDDVVDCTLFTALNSFDEILTVAENLSQLTAYFN